MNKDKVEKTLIEVLGDLSENIQHRYNNIEYWDLDSLDDYVQDFDEEEIAYFNQLSKGYGFTI